ncbi:hypothetical protein DB30_01061 [Enhygromyxa salina]|uniref:Uncharacterized protein n=1 Tax=Enhygromyxa salina TaxID=215803 RepID=A0A0C1ZNU9_9BACT|nr:hypothetical protein [Enhygromyxa salina]KIG12703.1 hypothetical protein DB30_01061 [Enhygromyxa salina]
MSTPKQEDHHEIPSLSSMAYLAVFLAVSLLGLVLFLQLKFGTPVP